MGPLPGDSGIAVVCKAQNADQWRFVSRFADEAQASAAVDRLTQGALPLTRAARQLHIVEHILLRGAAPEAAGDISFTITAVVISSHALAHDADFQAAVRAVVQANAPAAVAVQYCFLGPIEGLAFEILYSLWLAALRAGGVGDAAAPGQVQQFLRDHRTPDPA